MVKKNFQFFFLYVLVVSESMAEFLAAEQLVHAQGSDVRDSRLVAAMQSAQNQQEMYNSVKQKLVKGA